MALVQSTVISPCEGAWRWRQGSDPIFAAPWPLTFGAVSVGPTRDLAAFNLERLKTDACELAHSGLTLQTRRPIQGAFDGWISGHDSSVGTRRLMKALLAFAGRNGPALLFGGVLVGVIFPSLAAIAKPWMGAAVFVFMLGAFLKVEPAALFSEMRRPVRTLLVGAWVLFGVPLAGAATLAALPLPAEIRLGAALALLAPPVGSAAAIATMLRLNGALALAISVVASILSPVYLPPLARWAADSVAVDIDATGMLVRVLVVVGGAAALSSALRAGAPAAVRRNPHVMVGLSVVGLIVVAIGAMHGVRAFIDTHFGEVLLWIAVAFALNAGFHALGTLLFKRMDYVDAMTVGLLSGNRNVTLVWVAAAPWLTSAPRAEIFLAASVFPIFMMPMAIRQVLASHERHAAPTTLSVAGEPQVAGSGAAAPMPLR